MSLALLIPLALQAFTGLCNAEGAPAGGAVVRGYPKLAQFSKDMKILGSSGGLTTYSLHLPKLEEDEADWTYTYGGSVFNAHGTVTFKGALTTINDNCVLAKESILSVCSMSIAAQGGDPEALKDIEQANKAGSATLEGPDIETLVPLNIGGKGVAPGQTPDAPIPPATAPPAGKSSSNGLPAQTAAGSTSTASSSSTASAPKTSAAASKPAAATGAASHLNAGLAAPVLLGLGAVLAL